MKKFTFLIIIFFFMTAMLIAADSKKSVEDYIADLNSHKEEETIIKAADWAGEKQEKAALINLITLLKDKRENVRLHAVLALGYIADESAVEALNKTLLEDNSPEVRYAAILAAYRIGSKKSIDAYMKAKESESDPYIKDFLLKIEEKAKGK